MRAVNLIPAEERRSGSNPLREASTPTLLVLGLLLVALVTVIAIVLTGNQVRDRKNQLDAVNGQAQVVRQQAAALQPYAQVAKLRQQSVDTIRKLADARFDWPAMLDQISRRVPTDVDLTTFNGGTATDTSASNSLQLAGCTTSHTAVARLMDQMRAVRGVTDVTLGTSAKNTDGASASASVSVGDCPHSDQFNVTLALATAVAPTSTTTPAATP